MGQVMQPWVQTMHPSLLAMLPRVQVLYPWMWVMLPWALVVWAEHRQGAPGHHHPSPPQTGSPGCPLPGCPPRQRHWPGCSLKQACCTDWLGNVSGRPPRRRRRGPCLQIGILARPAQTVRHRTAPCSLCLPEGLRRGQGAGREQAAPASPHHSLQPLFAADSV